MNADHRDPLEDDDLPEAPPEITLEGEDAAEEGASDLRIEVAAPVDELKTVLAAELSTDATQHYLNQIGTRPLLTAPQEVHFATLAKAGDFGFIANQRGMFSYSGLSSAQVDRLREEFGIYAVGTGRICVAALNDHNIDRVADADSRRHAAPRLPDRASAHRSLVGGAQHRRGGLHRLRGR